MVSFSLCFMLYVLFKLERNHPTKPVQCVLKIKLFWYLQEKKCEGRINHAEVKTWPLLYDCLLFYRLISNILKYALLTRSLQIKTGLS